MKVYMRLQENEVKGTYFCDCHPLELPNIVALVTEVGVYAGDVVLHEMDYQFIHVDGNTGAEIVVDDSEVTP